MPTVAKQLWLLALAGVAATSSAHASALSSDQSTFTGTVTAVCEISDLAETTSLFYVSSSNSFTQAAGFSIQSNREVNISMNAISTVSEPSNVPSGTVPWARIEKGSGGSWTNLTSTTATKSRASSNAAAQNTINQKSSDYRIALWLYTGSKVNNRYQLLPGTYNYTVTINCLL